MNRFLHTILTIFRVRASFVSLEITDSSLRSLRFDGANWQTAGIRLPPGIVEGGYVRKYDDFVAALRMLATQIRGRGHRRMIDAIVSLGSSNIFTQVFALPAMKGQNLEVAIGLNIQMLSPVKAAQAYTGWQIIEESDESGRLEVLSSFINRSVVDDIAKALREAGFFVHAIESRALSLTRLIRETGAGFDPKASYLALALDATGLELVVIRKGQLYFDYFNSWKDIYGNEEKVSLAALETVIVRNAHQVLNFYNRHWPELLSGIFVSAGGLQEQVKKILADNFSLHVIDLSLSSAAQVNPQWYVALGTALRCQIPHKNDKELSLLGVSVQEEYRYHKSIDFLGFWSLLMPLALGILLVVLGVADVSLSSIKSSLESQPLYNLSGEQAKETIGLQGQVTNFNRSVNLIQKIEKERNEKGAIFSKLYDLLGQYNIILTRFSYQDGSPNAVLTGKAKREEQILQFKQALDSDKMFQSVDLPPAEVRFSPEGIDFKINFSIMPPPARPATSEARSARRA